MPIRAPPIIFRVCLIPSESSDMNHSSQLLGMNVAQASMRAHRAGTSLTVREFVQRRELHAVSKFQGF